MTKQIKKKLELPPKFERVQLIALQLAIGFVVLYYILKTEEVIGIFKAIPLKVMDGLLVLLFLKIITMLCGFCCVVLSGGKLVDLWKEIQQFKAVRKKILELEEKEDNEEVN